MSQPDAYLSLLRDITQVLEAGRRAAARSVNAVMTASYWLIGQRIVQEEQGGEARAGYGEALLKTLAADLSQQFGRGFSRSNLEQMRRFHLEWPVAVGAAACLGGDSRAGTGSIPQTVSGKSGDASAEDSPPGPVASISQTMSGKSGDAANESSPTTTAMPISQTLSAQSRVAVTFDVLAPRFPLPWSAYVRLLSVRSQEARAFYEAEAIRGSWTVRQLDRQIDSQYYERALLSKNKAALLRKGATAQPEDHMNPEEEIKDPFVLEFLNLKDEYSESELEEALIAKLEAFLLELGGDFTFAGRQRRLRVGDAWYRVDLVFFHRRLRCLVIIDLKLGKFTHADAGQMHLYLNYAREHWMIPGENPPVGLILCAQKHAAVAHYALEGLPNKVLAAEYRTVLPDEKLLAEELQRTKEALERHK